MTVRIILVAIGFVIGFIPCYVIGSRRKKKIISVTSKEYQVVKDKFGNEMTQY